MEKGLIAILMFLLVVIGIGILLEKTPTDNYCKDYIIEHQDEIVLTEGIKWESDKETLHFTIPTVKGYWGDVTIKYYDDNHYNVIFWTDRQKMEDREFLWKFLWYFKTDKIFDVDVSCREHNGENVDKDKLILNILKIY